MRDGSPLGIRPVFNGLVAKHSTSQASMNKRGERLICPR